MEFAEYMRIKRRMTKSDDDGCCKLGCSNCPLSYFNNKTVLECGDFEMLMTKEAEAVIAAWDAEHREKTMKMDFFEKNPNAQKNEYGIPEICPHHIGYKKNSKCDKRCIECWNRPLNEGE